MRKIVTKKALDEILHAWAHIGTNEARAIAVSYGIAPNYTKKLAAMNGVRAKTKRNRKPGCPTDPRWAWAIERGPIVV